MNKLPKIGVVTGSGLAASYVYTNPTLITKDIDIVNFLKSNKKDIKPYYKETIKWLANNGVTHGTIACNTFSIEGCEILKEFNIKPICEITSILFNEIKKYNGYKVGWLSTSMFKKRIPKDIKLVHISKTNQTTLDHIIFNELALGIITTQSIQEIQRIVDQLHCHTIAFGCTDLSIVKGFMHNRIIDSAQLHLNQLLSIKI